MQDKNKKEKTEYISLFEAAKISGYAQDYLSLLCRQGKLKGKKIGRNWLTTSQWLDEYQQNLISDIDTDTKKTFDAVRKAFKKERRIKITKTPCPQLLQRCGRAELVLATSLFFLILLGGFGYAKNPQFFSDFAPLEIMSRGLSQLNNNAKKISVSKINLKTEFLSDLAENVYQTENQIIYRMSDMGENISNAGENIYSVLSEAMKISSEAIETKTENIYSGLTDVSKSINSTGEKISDNVISFSDSFRNSAGAAKNHLTNRLFEMNQFLKNCHSELACLFGRQVSESVKNYEEILKQVQDDSKQIINAGKSIAVIPLQVGEKFGESVITYPIEIPMKIGDSFEKGFAKSDLVLNSSFGKFEDYSSSMVQEVHHDINNIVTLRLSNGINKIDFVAQNTFDKISLATKVKFLQLPKFNFRNFGLAIQDGVNNFSKGASVFFRTADKTAQEEFKTPSVGDFGHSMSEVSDGRVAGVSDSVDSVEVKPQQNLLKVNFNRISKFIWETPIKVADTYISAGRSLADGFNIFSDRVVGFSNKVAILSNQAAGFFKSGFNNISKKLANLFGDTYFGLTQLFVEQPGEKISQVPFSPGGGEKGDDILIEKKESDDPDRRFQESSDRNEEDERKDKGNEIENLKEGIDILKQEIDELKKASTGKIIQQNITQEIIREITKEQKGEQGLTGPQGPAGATGPQGSTGTGTTIVQGGDAYLSGGNTWIGGNVFEGHTLMNSLGVSHNTSVGDDFFVGGTTTLGTTAVDNLNVHATSNFYSSLNVTNDITQSGGQVAFGGNIDATSGLDVTGADLTVGGTNFVVDVVTGDITTAGSLTVGGAQTYSGAAAFESDSDTAAGLLVNQKGAGNIVQFQDGGTDIFTIADGGQTTITGNVDATSGLDITGITTLGDGGITNYAQFSATGDLTLVGTADTIQKSDGALTINTTGQNLTVSTTTSGDLSVSSAGALTATYSGGQIIGTGTNAIILGNSGSTLEFDSADWGITATGVVDNISGFTQTDGAFSQTGTTNSLDLTGAISWDTDSSMTVGAESYHLTTDGGNLAFTASGDVDLTATNFDIDSGTIDLSTQTTNITLNDAVDALNFDSNTLSIDASSDRVGIGVSDPDTKLEVYHAGTQLKLSYDGTDNTTFAVDTDGDLTITASGDEIKFGAENLSTSGTLSAGATTVTSLDVSSGGIIQAGAISGAGNITFSGSPTLKLGAADGSFTFTDSGDNTLMTLTDSGTTGDLSITGAMFQPVYGTDEGLVLDLPFDEGYYNTSSATAYDRSAFGNDGTLYYGDASGSNDTYADMWDQDGKYGKALEFDGTNDYVDTGSTFQSTFRDSFTIETWLKPTDGQPVSLEMFIGSKNAASEDYMSAYVTTTGKIHFRYESNNNFTLAETASAVFSNGQQDWHHIVMSVDKSVGSYGQIYLYFDGVLQTLDGTNDGDLDTYLAVMGDWTSVDELFIGARDNDGSSEYWFDGSIDGVKIYNRAISADEVKAHYLRGSTTHTDLALDTSSTAGNLFGNRIILTDTGDVSSGDDDSYGQKITATRTGATGGTIDTYGIHSTVTGDTGGTSTAVAGYFSATSADNNYGIIVEHGSVGIGTTAPSYKLDVHSSDTTYLSRIYNTSTNAAAAGLFIQVDGDGNLLTLNAGGTDIVTISEAQSTFNNPVSMAAAGDVSIAYDLLMANTTAGNIKFQGPGYIETDSSWQNLDLTLRAANTGQVIIDDNAYITGTLTVSGGTIDVSGAATDFEIIDNTASAFKISQLTNDYFNITTDDADTTFLIDLPVAGSSTTTANLFSGNVVKTINIGTGTAIDTINIGTDATGADIINIGSSGAGNLTLASAANIDLKSVSTSVLTVQDADRLKMRDKTLLAIGDINEAIIDDMEEVVSDWSVDPVGQTTVALEGTVVKVNDGAMKITTTSSGNSEGDTITNAISSADYSGNDRIGFWIQASATGQIISLEFNDNDAATDPHHDITIDTANRWHYEEWDISSYETDINAVTEIIFIIDEDEDAPTIYIDQLRYYDKDDRAGEMFVDGDGHLVLAGEEGIELQANITSSLPGLSIDSALVEVNQPFAVNVSGDTGINYDLSFLNTGSTFITSAGPLVIAAGDPNHSENLTITTQSNISGGDSGVVSASDSQVTTDDTKAWTTDEWINGTITIVSGTGAGQVRDILDNDGTTITVDDGDTVTDWSPVPDGTSVYSLAYARAGDVLVQVGHSDIVYGGFKILGMDGGGYIFRVSPDGDVEIGGAGSGGSDLAVKQNITLTGGNITIRQLDITDAGFADGDLSETADVDGTNNFCTEDDDYYYKITAINDNGETIGSSQAHILLATGANGFDDEKITVVWDAVDGAAGYKLYRSTENNDWDADPQDFWVDGRIIAAPTTILTDDCSDDTGSQSPPATNTTGGGATIAGTVTLVEDTAPDLILDNSTTGADADSGYITWRGNDGAADTELDMSIFLDVTSTTDYKLSIMDDEKSAEVASIDQSGNLQIDGTFVTSIDADTIADTGNGDPATHTLQPSTSYVSLTCSDADTCDITMSETGAVDGQIVRITNVSVNACDFADTAGISELAGVFAMGQYDTLELLYSVDRWVEISRSGN